MPHRTRPFTLLSMGGGQNSVALLLLFIHDPTFRARFVTGDLLVVMADTGAEHDETVAYVPTIRRMCEDTNIPFIHVTADLGYHTGTWAKGLAGHYEATATIGSVGFNSSCTDSLKIVPIYKAVEDWIAREYGFPTGRGKKALYAYVARYGRLNAQIGFGAEERHRVPEPAEQLAFENVIAAPKPRYKWFADCITAIYPLIELNMNRAACQAYIASCNETVPRPSLCKFCHWKSHQEVLLMKRTRPDDYALWVALEQRKLAAWKGRRSTKTGEIIKNLAAKREQTIEQFAADAEQRYGHWTTAELEAYAFSHGKCMRSRLVPAGSTPAISAA